SFLEAIYSLYSLLRFVSGISLHSSFTDQDLESFQCKYQEVYHQIGVRPKKDKTSILEDIDFQIDLLSTDRIDVQYIVNLVKAINLDNKDSRQRSEERRVGKEWRCE